MKHMYPMLSLLYGHTSGALIQNKVMKERRPPLLFACLFAALKLFVKSPFHPTCKEQPFATSYRHPRCHNAYCRMAIGVKIEGCFYEICHSYVLIFSQLCLYDQQEGKRKTRLAAA